MNSKKDLRGFRRMAALLLIIAINLAAIPAFAQNSPTVSDFTKTNFKNVAVDITATDFSSHFTDTNTPPLTLQKVQITELPEAAAGVLKNGDAVVNANDEIQVDSISALSFVPATDWVGSTSIKWKGSNGTDYSSNVAAINITIATPVVNQAPIAKDMTIETEKNISVTRQLQATDPEEDPLTFAIVDQPSKGTVTITNEATGAFTYTPGNNETGTDSFTFKANDGLFDSNVATVSITVKEPTQPTFSYADMLGHWASFSAGKLADRGILIGEKIGSKYYFYPDKVMNRAEFNLFLNAALGIDSSALGSEPAGFDDEDSIPNWVLKEARAAKKEGLINGVQAGSKLYYKPYSSINRLEVLTILHNALKPAVNNEAPLEYTDKDLIPQWAVQYVKNMRSYGIMKGYSDNGIHPFDTITRAQAAEFLYQLVKYKEANPE